MPVYAYLFSIYSISAYSRIYQSISLSIKRKKEKKRKTQKEQTTRERESFSFVTIVFNEQ